MSGIDHKALRLALRAILLTVSGLPSARAWEARTFEPPNPPAPWLRETLIPGSERLIATNNIMELGIYQLDLYHPETDEGTETVEALADAVKTAFRPTTNISTFGVVERAERLGGRRDHPWYIIPVRISYRAHGVNT